MELKLINEQGQPTASVAASDAAFGRDYNEALVHQVVTAYLANARSGTRAQKDRGTVKHSTKKLWRGGGRTFPNTPDENFTHKLNRKMYRAGVCSILSQLAREGRLSVVDQFTVEAPKTKLLAQKLKGMGLDDVLIITDTMDDNLRLSSRNLHTVAVVDVRHADPVSLIRHAKVLMTRGAVSKIEEMLS
jgi:large subunit ribosomal protein L4